MRWRKKRPSTGQGRIKRFLRWLKNRFWVSNKPIETSEDTSRRLKVYLFNVGQGDHILLELPNGEYGIIDFYYSGSVGLREPPAFTYLKNVRLKYPETPIIISFICISHYDSDHIKGVETFLKWVVTNEIKVRNFWLPAGQVFDELYEQYLMALKKYSKDEKERDRAHRFKNRLEGIRNYLESTAWTGNTDDLQNAPRTLASDMAGYLQVVLLAPLTRHIKKLNKQVWQDIFKSIIKKQKTASAQTNLMSSVLLMNFNKHKLLFGGDTELHTWLECLEEFARGRHQKQYGSCRAAFIKASHHGSKNSSSVDLWRGIMDRNSWIGISAGRGYGHPHGQTIKDIYTAAQDNRLHVEIVSTNTCTNCLTGQTFNTEVLDKLIHPPTHFPSPVIQALNRSKPASHLSRKMAMSLGAYVFRFSVSGNSVTLTKGVFPTKVGSKECVYNNSSNGPFPQCAC